MYIFINFWFLYKRTFFRSPSKKEKSPLVHYCSELMFKMFTLHIVGIVNKHLFWRSDCNIDWKHKTFSIDFTTKKSPWMQIDSFDCTSKEPIQLRFRISTFDMRIHEVDVLKTEIDKHFMWSAVKLTQIRFYEHALIYARAGKSINCIVKIRTIIFGQSCDTNVIGIWLINQIAVSFQSYHIATQYRRIMTRAVKLWLLPLSVVVWSRTHSKNDLHNYKFRWRYRYGFIFINLKKTI